MGLSFGTACLACRPVFLECFQYQFCYTHLLGFPMDLELRSEDFPKLLNSAYLTIT